MFLSGCTFSLVSLQLCAYCDQECDQVNAKVDLITFLITTESSLGKQTLEKRQEHDVRISLVCYQVVAQVSVATIISRCYGAAFFLEVCMCDGFGDPYKAMRTDKSHELGHAGQTNTGASCTGKLHSQSVRLGVLIDIDVCSCIQDPVCKSGIIKKELI